MACVMDSKFTQMCIYNKFMFLEKYLIFWKKLTFILSSDYLYSDYAYTGIYKKRIKFNAFRKEQGKKKYKKVKIKKKGKNIHKVQ